MGTESGVKLDEGKVDPTFNLEYFPRALMAVAEVSGFGAKKYTRGGWKSVEDGIHRYTAALERHMLKEQIEGPYDVYDSCLLHAAQAAWNALARLELMLIEGKAVCKRNDLDPGVSPSLAPFGELDRKATVSPLHERVLEVLAEERRQRAKGVDLPF